MIEIPDNSRGPIIQLELPPSLKVELADPAGAGFGLATDGTYLYFSQEPEKIGRAKLDGTEVNSSFITGCKQVRGIAVNATHIFWANAETGAIGRATIAGGTVNQAFIAGASNPQGVAVNATHIFWTNNGTSAIGRATIAGGTINQTYISGAANVATPFPITVDGTYIYWGNNGFVTGQAAHSISRAKLDGTEPKVLVAGRFQPTGLAVDGTYIYWAQAIEADRKLSRAKLDGTEVNEPLVSGIKSAEGLVVYKGRIYFGNYFQTPGVISRADVIKAIVKNNTTKQQMALNIPAGWDGTDLVIDFYRRSVKDVNGVDRSSFVDPADHALWLAANPLVAGKNDVEIEFKSESGGGASAFAYAAKATLTWEKGYF